MTVKEQLAEYCDCIEVEDKDVEELINLISVYTCWTGEVCSTFLSGSRREVIDLPDCVCDCDVLEYEPFYSPYVAGSFTFTLIEIDGINETAVPIRNYNHSMVEDKFRIELPLQNCKCGCRTECGCPTKYKLLVTYTAGYNEIPDCLLPIFCEALQWIKDKNTCDCECVPCQDDSSERKYYEIDYSTLEGTLKDYFTRVLTMQYRNLLSTISLCDHKDKVKFWAVVV